MLAKLRQIKSKTEAVRSAEATDGMGEFAKARKPVEGDKSELVRWWNSGGLAAVDQVGGVLGEVGVSFFLFFHFLCLHMQGRSQYSSIFNQRLRTQAGSCPKTRGEPFVGTLSPDRRTWPRCRCRCRFTEARVGATESLAALL
jgi:hypothetical protein